MFQKIRNKTYKATKALAARHAGLEGVAADRPLDPFRFALRCQAIKEGSLRDLEWATAYCEWDGKTVRVNGKTTSNALLEVGIPDGLEIVVQEFWCGTPEDLLALYATFDRLDQVRSASEINRAAATVDADLGEVGARVRDLAVSGMSIAIDGFTTRVTALDKSKRLYEHKGFVLWLNGMIRWSKSARHMRRASVIAAMFDSFRESPEAATAFWTLVRDESGRSPKAIDRALAKWLCVNNVDSGKGSAGYRKQSPREFYARCRIDWKAWLKQQPSANYGRSAAAASSFRVAAKAVS